MVEDGSCFSLCRVYCKSEGKHCECSKVWLTPGFDHNLQVLLYILWSIYVTFHKSHFLPAANEFFGWRCASNDHSDIKPTVTAMKGVPRLSYSQHVHPLPTTQIPEICTCRDNSGLVWTCLMSMYRCLATLMIQPDTCIPTQPCNWVLVIL